MARKVVFWILGIALILVGLYLLLPGFFLFFFAEEYTINASQLCFYGLALAAMGAGSIFLAQRKKAEMPVIKICPTCKAQIHNDMPFCVFCGSAINHNAQISKNP